MKGNLIFSRFQKEIVTLASALLAIGVVALVLKSTSKEKVERVPELPQSRTSTTETLPEAISDIHTTTPISAPRSSTTNLSERLKQAKQLYQDLWALRFNPEFYKSGLTIPAGQQWMLLAKNLTDDPELTKALLEKRVAIQDLNELALEWINTKGADTDTSTAFVVYWDRAFGLKHVIDRKEKEQAPDPSAKKTDLETVGVWKMNDASLLIDTISITKAAGGRYSIVYTFTEGSKQLNLTGIGISSGSGFTITLDDNPSGDFIKLTSSGTLELRDPIGLINTGRKLR